jgi:hypothetical protein
MLAIAVAFLGVGELLIVIWMFLCLRRIDEKLEGIYAMVLGSIEVIPSTGNITSGTCSLYGVEDRGLDDQEGDGDPDGA